MGARKDAAALGGYGRAGGPCHQGDSPMSGFSADWLSRREPADHRARDSGLLDRLAAWAASRDSLSIVDLGCGTGSNARAVMPQLSATQHWRLIDYDPALLAV